MIDFHPIFIVCDARSGSTLVANLLMRSFPIVLTPESNFIPRLINRGYDRCLECDKSLRRGLDIAYSDRKFNDFELDRERLFARIRPLLPVTISDLIREILLAYWEEKSPDARLCGVKKGSYVYYLEPLLELFPNAQFLGLVRDGRAVFNSKKSSIYSRTGKPFETDPTVAAQTWCDKVTRLRQFESKTKRVKIMHYEQIIFDKDTVVDEIGCFLGLTKRTFESSEDDYVVGSRYHPDLHRNISKEPLQERVSAWREQLSRQEIEQYQSVAQTQLERENYRLIPT